MDLFHDKQFRHLDIAPEDVEAALVGSNIQTFADAVRTVFAAYAAKRAKALYGDKTPNYVKSLDLIAAIFPEARFVHIVRDGRDVALSSLEAPFGPRTIQDAAWNWRQSVGRGRKSGERLGSTRYLEVRYEELVANPREVVTTICEFLNLPFDVGMLGYNLRAPELIGATDAPLSHTRLSEPPSKRRDWRKELTEEDLQAFEAIAGRMLEKFGYSCACRQADLRPVSMRWTSGMRWQAKRASYRLRHIRRRILFSDR